MIGLAAPGKYYSPFIDRYLDVASWLRSSLLHGSQWMLSLFRIDSYFNSEYVLSMVRGRGVKLVYSCLGLGVMSFWVAFVIASFTSVKRKFAWIIIGLFIIWLINVSRISLLLLAINRGWKIPLGINHHTWFNIVAYGAIFLMMWFFSKSKGKSENPKVDEGNDRNLSSNPLDGEKTVSSTNI